MGKNQLAESNIRLLLFVLFCIHVSGATTILAQRISVRTFNETLQQAQQKTENQQWNEAVSLWGKIVAANPYRGTLWKQLANARYNAGDYRGAISAWEKIAELKADFPWGPPYNIARAYARLGDETQSLKWLVQAFALGYRYVRAAQMDRDFDTLHDNPIFKKLTGLEDTSKMSRIEGWRYDLKFLKREIKRIHYKAFEKVSPQSFTATVDRLYADIPKLTDEQIAVGFMKIFSLMGDGHTIIRPVYLWPDTRRAIPVEFYLFEEGLFIVSAGAGYSDLLGSQVVKIGNYSIDETIESLKPIISRENDMWIKHIAPNLMRNPQILNGLGLIPAPGRLPLTVKDSAGNIRTLSLETLAGEPTGDWKRFEQTLTVKIPLYLKNKSANYWFEYLPDKKTVYFQYNLVLDDDREPIDKFSERLFRFIDENDIEKLIVDMRLNDGGNNFLNQSIIHGLIRSKKINRRGKLFVIVGRNTFSAAMNCAAEIERNTDAIFVGEPTGSSPNFVGESVIMVLPYSKMRGSISDLYWQSSVAMDYRIWIAPLIYEPPTFADFRAGRDAALEAILDYREAN